jgi:hypothetical protein
VSSTLYCAFAAEAYVNVALIRLLDEDEYRPLSKVPVRSKYFLATRLGMQEQWFSAGEQVLEDLDELFSQRNRLVHAQPETSILHPFSDPKDPDLHTDLRNVARWIGATADAASRLGRSHAELAGFDRVAGRLTELEPIFRAFEPERDGERLGASIREVLRDVVRDDEHDFLAEEDIEALLADLDPDWDVRGLDDA